MKNKEELDHENSMLNFQIKNAIDEISRLTIENKRLTSLIEENDLRANLFMNNKLFADNIFQQQMTKYNSEHQQLLEKINLLTKKLREYGYIGELVD